MSERRVHTPTAEDSARWRKAVEEELRAKPENIERARRFRKALAEQSIAGQLRRAIVDSRLRTADLADRAGVAEAALDAFLFAEARRLTRTHSAESRGFSTTSCHAAHEAHCRKAASRS